MASSMFQPRYHSYIMSPLTRSRKRLGMERSPSLLDTRGNHLVERTQPDPYLSLKRNDKVVHLFGFASSRRCEIPILDPQ